MNLYRIITRQRYSTRGSIESFKNADGLPRRLELKGVSSSDVAEYLGARIQGPNREIKWVSGLDDNVPTNSLVYLSEEPYAKHLQNCDVTVITDESLVRYVPQRCTAIVVESEPRGEWSRAISYLQKYREEFPTFIDSSCRLHKTAVIGKEVYLDRNTEVHENTVLRGPLYVGPNSVIGPGSVVGNDGFESTMSRGKRIVVAHLGGIWISNDVEIHANTTVDKGLDGGFTIIGSGTKIDNLVHIAHAVRIGNNCVILACTEISGSVTIGDNVWLAPNTTITNGITIGDHSMVGIGAVVLRDVQKNSVIVGHHRLIGFRCACGRRLTGIDSNKQCSCGHVWVEEDHDKSSQDTS
jgi:UDP-3-O-[3-hydroxymyristoyl] glucosamine N-acyltransferase